MQVFVFQSETDRGIYGFTIERDGGNLPARFRPWRSCGNQAVPISGTPAGSGNGVLMQHLQAEGYYLTRQASPTI